MSFTINEDDVVNVIYIAEIKTGELVLGRSYICFYYIFNVGKIITVNK